MGGGGCTPHLRHLAQWGVQCSIALSTLLGVKPLLEAFGPVGVNPPKGSGRAVRGIWPDRTPRRVLGRWPNSYSSGVLTPEEAFSPLGEVPEYPLVRH